MVFTDDNTLVFGFCSQRTCSAVALQQKCSSSSSSAWRAAAACSTALKGLCECVCVFMFVCVSMCVTHTRILTCTHSCSCSNNAHMHTGNKQTNTHMPTHSCSCWNADPICLAVPPPHRGCCLLNLAPPFPEMPASCAPAQHIMRPQAQLISILSLFNSEHVDKAKWHSVLCTCAAHEATSTVTQTALLCSVSSRSSLDECGTDWSQITSLWFPCVHHNPYCYKHNDALYGW